MNKNRLQETTQGKLRQQCLQQTIQERLVWTIHITIKNTRTFNMDRVTKQHRENCHAPAKALYTRTIITGRLKPRTTKNDIRHNYILAETKRKRRIKAGWIKTSHKETTEKLAQINHKGTAKMTWLIWATLRQLISMHSLTAAYCGDRE